MQSSNRIWQVAHYFFGWYFIGSCKLRFASVHSFRKDWHRKHLTVMRTGSNKIQVSKRFIMMYVCSYRTTSLPLNVRLWMVSFREPQQLVGTELYHSMHGNASGNMELETVRILMLTCGQTYLKLNFVLWMWMNYLWCIEQPMLPGSIRIPVTWNLNTMSCFH